MIRTKRSSFCTVYKNVIQNEWALQGRLKNQTRSIQYIQGEFRFQWGDGMVIVFNATFNNISVISWWSVLLVEKTIDLLSQVTNIK